LVLVLDDEEEICSQAEEALKGLCRVIKSHTASGALKLLSQHEVDCVLFEQVLPDMDTADFLGRLSEGVWPPAAVMLATLPGSGPVLAALERGMCGYLVKPSCPAEMRSHVAKAIEKRRMERENTYMREALDDAMPSEIIGRSPAMAGVRSLVANVAGADASVLISGESGTGKELVARAIHRAGPRGANPFVVIRCSYRRGDECRIDLFGEETPSKPGGRRRIGRLEYADGGTVMIEDVEWLPMVAQESLLSVIQDKRIVREGGKKPVPVNLRIIATTTTDLREAVAQGTFRQDLYWRLAVVSVHMPPLRERVEDLADLLPHFLASHSCRYGREMPEIAPEAMKLLDAHNWPGNIDELDHMIQHVLRESDGHTVKKEDLPVEMLMSGQIRRLMEAESVEGEDDEGALRHARMEFERLFIFKVLEQFGGNQVKAAKVLGVHRNTLINKMNELNLRYASSRPRRRWLEADS
jgi:DNA-binding NtrC family response regulator